MYKNNLSICVKFPLQSHTNLKEQVLYAGIAGSLKEQLNKKEDSEGGAEFPRNLWR